MGYKTELHCHSKEFSWCASHAAQDIVAQYRSCGYTTIVLTNHLSPSYFDIYKGLSWEQLIRKHFAAVETMRECAGDSMNVIAGTEIRFRENGNDYLVFGMDEEAFLAVPDALEYIRVLRRGCFQRSAGDTGSPVPPRHDRHRL